MNVYYHSMGHTILNSYIVVNHTKDPCHAGLLTALG